MLMNLTIKEAASSIKESPHIIRNWLREYKGLIPLEKGENGYNYFTPEGLEVLRTIKRLIRDQGYSTRQVGHYLSGGEVAAASETEAPAVAAAEIGELQAMMQQLMQRQEEQAQQQHDFNRALIEQLEQRDKLLREYMNERRQERLELKQQQEQQKRPWWSFLARK